MGARKARRSGAFLVRERRESVGDRRDFLEVRLEQGLDLRGSRAVPSRQDARSADRHSYRGKLSCQQLIY